MHTIRINLKSILHERGITQRELAEAAGLREASISDFANNSRASLHKENFASICATLGITDLNEILKLVDLN